jgi:hypothetical protein
MSPIRNGYKYQRGDLYQLASQADQGLTTKQDAPRLPGGCMAALVGLFLTKSLVV